MASRRAIVAAIIIVTVLGSLALGPPSVPTSGAWALAREVMAAAVQPAMVHQTEVPSDAPPLLWRVAAAAGRTVVFAAAALGLSLVAGFGLGVAGSTGRAERETRLRRWIGRAARLVSAGLRSVHELLWAALLLAAVGSPPWVAMVAIALPFAGAFGKVFGEQLDEVDDRAGRVLRAAGVPRSLAFGMGILPAAAPGLIAYAFYRFECAVRSAAVIGFFGVPTLGAEIITAFNASQYGEMWTAVYAVVLVSIGVEWWSAAVRRRLAA
ncbi:MAG: PhnE/PtxC family ABC transporter permease [Phycisphaerales bacterium]